MKKYQITWNIGDDFWDMTDEEYYDTIEEVEKAIGRKLTKEELNDRYAADEDGERYYVSWEG